MDNLLSLFSCYGTQLISSENKDYSHLFPELSLLSPCNSVILAKKFLQNQGENDDEPPHSNWLFDVYHLPEITMNSSHSNLFNSLRYECIRMKYHIQQIKISFKQYEKILQKKIEVLEFIMLYLRRVAVAWKETNLSRININQVNQNLREKEIYFGKKLFTRNKGLLRDIYSIQYHCDQGIISLFNILHSMIDNR